MPPFFGDDGGEIIHQLFLIGIPLNKGNAAGGGFLFAVGMICQDLAKGNRGKVYPPGISREV
jgi:hypothetical protein